MHLVDSYYHCRRIHLGDFKAQAIAQTAQMPICAKKYTLIIACLFFIKAPHTADTFSTGIYTTTNNIK